MQHKIVSTIEKKWTCLVKVHFEFRPQDIKGHLYLQNLSKCNLYVIRLSKKSAKFSTLIYDEKLESSTLNAFWRFRLTVFSLSSFD